MEYEGYVEEGSRLLTDTGVVYIVNCYIESKKGQCKISVPNKNVKDYISYEHIKKLSEYFKASVSIVIDPDMVAQHASQKAKNNSQNVPDSIPPKKIKGELLGQDFMYEGYITTPFFKGQSNAIAINMRDSFISRKNPQMYVVYGPTGTGKSHLIQKTAYEEKAKGKIIYLNSTNNFIEDVKNSFKKDNKAIINILKDADYFILDDMQRLNNESLNFVCNALFDIINFMVERGKKVMFATDRIPSLLTEIPDRIRSRFSMGYSSEIGYPDDDIKEQYINFRIDSEGVTFTKEEKEIIKSSSISLRSLEGQLMFVLAAKQTGTYNMDNLISMVSGGKDPATAILDAWDTRYQETYRQLKEYYGIIGVGLGSGRRSESEAQFTALMFWLFSKHLDKKILKDRLAIRAQTYGYYNKKGEKEYAKLPDEVKKILQDILKK